MTVRDLNREQLNELKETYATQLAETDQEVISYERTEIPYEGITFLEDNFFCSCGK